MVLLTDFGRRPNTFCVDVDSGAFDGKDIRRQDLRQGAVNDEVLKYNRVVTNRASPDELPLADLGEESRSIKSVKVAARRRTAGTLHFDERNFADQRHCTSTVDKIDNLSFRDGRDTHDELFMSNFLHQLDGYDETK